MIQRRKENDDQTTRLEIPRLKKILQRIGLQYSVIPNLQMSNHTDRLSSRIVPIQNQRRCTDRRNTVDRQSQTVTATLTGSAGQTIQLPWVQASVARPSSSEVLLPRRIDSNKHRAHHFITQQQRSVGRSCLQYETRKIDDVLSATDRSSLARPG